MRTRRLLTVAMASAIIAVCWSYWGDCGQTRADTPAVAATATSAPGTMQPTTQYHMRRITQADRLGAAARLAAAKPQGAKLLAAPLAAKPLAAALNPRGTPDYFGTTPNYANSPILQKFVDTLPGLGAANANNLGQYIPVANPDTVTFPGSDYYEIALQDYTEVMHTDLKLTPTKLRGYVQTNKGTDPNVANPTAANNTIAPAPIHYLGPVIIAKKDRPVRVKFTNKLATGAAGNLFLPVDTSVMGAGTGPLAMSANNMEKYTQNRAVIHLHGGATAWISDGTPHQWITPAGEVTSYKKGVSQTNVPDMWFDATGKVVAAGTAGATNDPGAGSATYYYSNQQSCRLMFYHDHSYGITRLNVYAGEAAGYVVTDATEDGLINAGTIPGNGAGVYRYGVPLIIQDKTFVPDDASLIAQDPTWDKAAWGGKGNLWFPHVYMPNQNPADPAGANAMGRWDYGPWFWPPVTILNHMPIPGVNGAPDTPATPNPSLVPEAFMDTPIVNGTAYPVLAVQRKAYRFRILNACNDRFLNLQLYYVDPNAPTELKMVPAVPHPGDLTWPATWPTDGRDGGVPDPTTVGPDMIQIGTEGGILPAPAIIHPQPIGYNYNRRDITVLNVSDKALFLGPAERADVIVDFSSVPDGARLILYNDAPAPVPAFDPRNDYYTGDLDNTSTGGAPPTLAGYGPNTRTVMQFQVGGLAAQPYNLAGLQAALPTAFKATQPKPIINQTVYGGTTDTYSRIQDTSLTYKPAGSNVAVTTPMLAKAIQELFELDYGRMNAVLGVELPLTNFNIQTTLVFGYIDPPTENILNGSTQIWKITHNGVDTHAIHFHLFNVQLINRVGWDGMVKPPDANEQGWKDTVRMNPLEDCIVALTPIVPTAPFKLPDSIRLLDPTMPAGSTVGFANVDPTTGNPVTTTNQLTNFGWEYVWHCHLLGHEENDMMRPIAVQVAPMAPGSLIAGAQAPTTKNPPQVLLAWINNATLPAATNLTIQRATDALFTKNVVTYNVATPASTTYSDTTNLTPLTKYYYRVRAENNLGYSEWSNVASATTTSFLLPPTNLQATTIGTNYVILAWTNNAVGQTGFTVQISTNGGKTWSSVGKTAANVFTIRDNGLRTKTSYMYRVQAYDAKSTSPWSTVLLVTTK